MCLREVPSPGGNVRSVRLICRSGELQAYPAFASHAWLDADSVVRSLTSYRSPAKINATTSPTSKVRAAGTRSRGAPPVLGHRPIKESGAPRVPVAWIIQLVFQLPAPTRPCDFWMATVSTTRYGVGSGRLDARSSKRLPPGATDVRPSLRLQIKTLVSLSEFSRLVLCWLSSPVRTKIRTKLSGSWVRGMAESLTRW
jgi:hypothetical protein